MNDDYYLEVIAGDTFLIKDFMSVEFQIDSENSQTLKNCVHAAGIFALVIVHVLAYRGRFITFTGHGSFLSGSELPPRVFCIFGCLLVSLFVILFCCIYFWLLFFVFSLFGQPRS